MTVMSQLPQGHDGRTAAGDTKSNVIILTVNRLKRLLKVKLEA